MEQKLDQILSLLTTFHHDFTAFKAETAANFARLEERIIRLEARVAALEERVAALEERVAALEERVAALEARVSALEDQFADFKLEFNSHRQEFIAFTEETATHFAIVERDITALHEKTNKMEGQLSLLNEKTSLAIKLIPSHFELKEQVFAQQNQIMKLQDSFAEQVEVAV
ncbi:hypothetical protein EV586_101790 [Tumebacillus sp. BK434]|uniref:hypothetical protein n=1 Tax=Tumebacillus sp. BK434 TaxID=2512169 RepID=UPI001050BE94|nr:hypothetical protein [Tumebacillus sp. BK434]TCP59561.1 hypothetical protein EV586_101790 [Tumebacillus sp. BK434]